MYDCLHYFTIISRLFRDISYNQLSGPLPTWLERSSLEAYDTVSHLEAFLE